MRSRLLALSLTIAACPVFGQSNITAFVYDYAQTKPDLVRAAEARAEVVLGEAGVRVTWRNCGPDNECPGVLTPSDVVLSLEPNARPRLPAGALGQSLLTGGDGYAAYARVFVSPVLRRAQEAWMAPQALLGYAIAHEIGHLMLGPEHTAYGLMRQRWTSDEENRIRVGSLRFDSKQAAAMRSGVAERIASARGATRVASNSATSGSEERHEGVGAP